jgi:hypothetical protein
VSDHDLQLREPIVEPAKTGERADRRLLIIDARAGPYAVLELRVVRAGAQIEPSPSRSSTRSKGGSA